MFQSKGGEVEPAAGHVVAEAVGRKQPLDVLLVSGGRGVHKRDGLGPDDLLLQAAAMLEARCRRRGRLALEGQVHPALGKHLVRCVEVVEHPGHTYVRHGLVDDLLRRDGRDADVERRPEHHPKLNRPPDRDHRGELAEQPRRLVELRGPEDLVEGEVVEQVDELGVRHREGGDVAGQHACVVRVRCFVRRHHAAPTRRRLLIARRSSIAS